MLNVSPGLKTRRRKPEQESTVPSPPDTLHDFPSRSAPDSRLSSSNLPSFVLAFRSDRIRSYIYFLNLRIR
ncbi:uncharacterized [Tachysurus ichikawai]